ncbi:MAG TPA: MBL fold metallo-hydrolase [Candidatus Thermoplasmatota archaeon]|nr:MBL fold metallo-hydrolase [Candidatus Thermoplasmatota archaeon]
MRVTQHQIGDMANFVYVLVDEATGAGALVDPAFEVEELVRLARRDCDRIDLILVTHGHWDHTDGVPEAKRLTGARVVAHHQSPVKPDVGVRDGDTVRLGETELKCIATPGHEPTSICYYGGGHVLTGDTLFVGECGRADLPGSDPAQLWHSLLNVLAKLPPETVVLPGHDYGKTPTSTIGRELAENYVLKPRTREEFVRFVLSP